MLETPDLFDNFGFDEVRLIDPHGIEVDRFTYMAPARGTSFGRIPDRVGDWQAGLDPTPGALNDSSPTFTPTETLLPIETATSSQTETMTVPTETPIETVTPTETV